MVDKVKNAPLKDRPVRPDLPVADDVAGVGLLSSLASIAPRLKTPIQLAGFLFSVLAATLIQRLNPSNTQALVVVGSIGVALISIPLLFHPSILKLIPAAHRVILILASLFLLLFSFGALAFVTKAAISLSPDGIRFDSMLEPSNVRVINKNADGSARVEIIWRLVPLTKSADQSATIFTGMVVLHDEGGVADSGIGGTTDKTCAQVETCLGHHVFSEYMRQPVYVRGDGSGNNLTTVVNLKRVPASLRVWWEFFQLEGKEGATCGVDHKYSAPVEGVPPLTMFGSNNQRLEGGCYRSFGQRTVTFS